MRFAPLRHSSTRERRMKLDPIAMILVSALGAVPAHATVTIDGRLDPDYGSAVVTQATQTSSLDDPPGFGEPDSISASLGSELDAGYGFVADGVLHVFLAGNVMSDFGEIPHYDQLHLFIDCGAGGQNTLRSDNADAGFSSKLNDLAGMRFDAEFVPDYWFDCTIPPGIGASLYAYSAQLLGGGGGSGDYLGREVIGVTATLSGGTNPHGVMVSIDDSNSGGVTHGCGSASGAGVTTGVEWAIPLAAIGNPGGPIRLCALIGSASDPYLSNQVLGPLPPGTCGLGAPAGVDFGSIPGAQYFTIENGATPIRPASWGTLKIRYR